MSQPKTVGAQLAELLAREANKSESDRRNWLVVFPASGTARRYYGALVAVDVGGETGVAPFIVMRGGKAVTLDPRVLILDDHTLGVAWHPREQMARPHPMAREWFGKNPDVFASPSGEVRGESIPLE